MTNNIDILKKYSFDDDDLAKIIKETLNDSVVSEKSIVSSFDTLKFDALRDNFKLISGMDISNIVRIYKEKIDIVSGDFNSKSIDFWSKDFIFGDAIIKRLESNVFDASSVLNEIVNTIDRLDASYIEDNHLNDVGAKVIFPLVKRYEKACSFVKNYDVNTDLKNTLINYYDDDKFTDMDHDVMKSNISLMKNNVESSGMKDKFDEVFPSLLDFINEMRRSNKNKGVKSL